MFLSYTESQQEVQSPMGGRKWTGGSGRPDRTFTLDEAEAIRAYMKLAQLLYPEADSEKSLACHLKTDGLPTPMDIAATRNSNSQVMFRLLHYISFVRPCLQHPQRINKCYCNIPEEHHAIVKAYRQMASKRQGEWERQKRRKTKADAA